MLNQFYGEAMVNIKVVSKLGAVGSNLAGLLVVGAHPLFSPEIIVFV